VLSDYIQSVEGHSTDGHKGMKRLFAVILAVACLVESTSVFARGGGHGFGRGSYARATTRLAPPTPQAPLESRIPAPLAAPAQAPVINGPLSQPAFRGLTGIGQ
jgi:hypothetical protein